MPPAKRSISAAITLFFVAPFVAEFLLGNIPIKMLFILVVLAPMYGGGAVVIRELARRAHRGWPTILMLGCAYCLIEEGFVDQSLTNPDYLGLHGHFLVPAFVPALGIGLWWTLFMFNLHVFFSVATSIALVESLVPSRRTTPWLGPIGLAIFGLLFLFGGSMIAIHTYKTDHFLTSTPQLIGIAIAALILIVIAFRLPAKLSATQGPVPSAWMSGVIALLFGFLMLIVPSYWNWGAVAAMFSLDLIFLFILATLSRRPAWQPIHTLSVAAGGALAYGLHAFIETPAIPGSSLTSVRIGNAIFLAIAIGLIALAAHRTARTVDTGKVEGYGL